MLLLKPVLLTTAGNLINFIFGLTTFYLGLSVIVFSIFVRVNSAENIIDFNT